jgi:leader peptidase (prepilin peptidase)/N-methyltransferase
MSDAEQLGFLAMLATSPVLLVACCAVLGLLIGSFLNVVIHRVPIMMDNELRAECAALAGAEDPAAMEETLPTQATIEMFGTEAGDSPQPAQAARYNLVVPRSACPHCKAPITALQNIPVVSWLALGGKCASCRAPISPRYPLVELATGVLSGYIAWHFGFGLNCLAALLFTWFLIALTMIDFDTQFLPDQLTYPLLWLGLLMSLSHPVWSQGAAPLTPRDSIIGAVAGYLFLWSVYWAFKLLTGKEGMGYGDFKLFAALGAWMGWQMLLPILLISSGVGAVIGIIVMIRQRKGRDMQIAFGPFLAVAGWVTLIVGHELVSKYFAFFGEG